MIFHVTLRKVFLCLSLLTVAVSFSQPANGFKLQFDHIPSVWDEGLPMGNGLLGAMVWQKENKLRLSLDRADIWDLRTVDEFNLDEWNYSWVYQRWLQPGEYMAVQQLFDQPYERDAAPTKIPAAYLEFPLQNFGKVTAASLDIRSARCTITWDDGVIWESYIHATDPVGFFRISGLKKEISPTLLLPRFRPGKGDVGQAKGLERLNYPAAVTTITDHQIVVKQETYNKAWYEIHLKWQYHQGVLTGIWTIQSYYPGDKVIPSGSTVLSEFDTVGYDQKYGEHQNWWRNFWAQSTVKIPDTVLQKQYNMEIYKMGCVSRKGAPAASLQAVWTRDDDNRLPPWKNDFHHDLNTQMTYWPCYTANHLAESAVFTDWLWNYKPVAEKYTRKYFGAEGLNFPGVSALNGYPLGGWIQYAFSSTTSAWLSQHFYWQWKYSMDRQFLEHRAYPWTSETAVFLENMSVIFPDSSRRLLMSSSPELNDNAATAWFKKNTNYDLSLIRSLFQNAIEMAGILGLTQDKIRWEKDLSQFPPLVLDPPDSSLIICEGQKLPYSHRHFSHLMAVYPLGLLDPLSSQVQMRVTQNSLSHIDSLGTRQWTGYSFAWYALLQARTGNGNKALENLRIFTSAFTSANSFHLNGDHASMGYSDNHDRIFTLEGNMAFAAAIQEMLLQSYNGVIRVFPAIPDTWKNVSFVNLRAEGAFVITATRDIGKTRKIMIVAEKGGLLKILNPFTSGTVTISGVADYTSEGKILIANTRPGQIITLEAQSNN